jgi:hypothetical protein
VLPASISKFAAVALPDSLLIPEESTPLHFAYGVPFASFLDLGAMSTPASTYNFYSPAFRANLVNDASAGRLAAAISQLIQQVKNGDVFMTHVDSWQANNPNIVAIYQDAVTASMAPTPAPTVPMPTAISWATPGAITTGTRLSAAQLPSRHQCLRHFRSSLRPPPMGALASCIRLPETPFPVSSR